jgi:hypothetical protein
MKTTLIFILLITSLNAFSYPSECKGMEDQFASELSRFQSRNLKNKTLFIGSSSIRMWKKIYRYFEELYWSSQDSNYYNRGFGGSQICHLLIHYKKLFLGAKPELNPKRVVIYSGDNDLNNHDAQTIVTHYSILIEKLRAAGLNSPIYIIATKPSIVRLHQKEEIKLIGELLESQLDGVNGVTIINTFHEFFDENDEIRKDYFLSDGLHLKEIVYWKWAWYLKRAWSL